MHRAKKGQKRRGIRATHAVPRFLLSCRDLLVDSLDQREARRRLQEGVAEIDGKCLLDDEYGAVVVVTARGSDELGVLS